MRAEGDPAAWWRHLPDDPDDDADVGAVAAPAPTVEQSEKPEKPVFEELPPGLYMADLLQDERVQAVIHELVSPCEQSKKLEQHEPEPEPRSMTKAEELAEHWEGVTGSSVVA